ncbi:MAG: sigma-70 family RNA polymerase sigma factor [Candidatus Rokubacteria bacterium]|nr:sigma-70 family RNA polymerase sigma factor [Candidatus Rokubacteria bacterium]
MNSDDSELVERCRAGDLSAFEPLVEKYRQRVWRLAFYILRDREEAWDVAQEAFVRAYQSLPTFRGQSAFYTWVFRIVVNLATDRQRQRAARSRALGGEPVPAEEWGRTMPDPTAGPELLAVRAEERELIRRALDSLPPNQRTIIMLSDVEGLVYREIAEALGIPMGTVMSRLHNARKRLRTLLGPLLGVALIVCLGMAPVAAWAQQVAAVTVRVLLQTRQMPGAPPARGQAADPYMKKFQQHFPNRQYEQLDLIQARVPVGKAQRFALPGGRELEILPTGFRGPVARMSFKILNRGTPEVSVSADMPPGKPFSIAGPPHGPGVLHLVIVSGE